MRFASGTTSFGVALIVSSIGLLPAGQSYAAASGEAAIKARIDFMKDDVEAHWKPLAAFASKGTGSLGDVEKNALVLRDLTKKLPDHFPKDTGRGKYPDKLTRTLPVVWENWDGFRAANQRLATETEKLARLAKEGNKDAVIDMIGKSGSYAKTKIGCAECHSDFRGERVK